MVRIIKKAMGIFMICCLGLGCTATLAGCAGMPDCSGIDLSFEGRCKTTEDGFVYYEDGEIGLCIVGFPDSEEVVIPEFIDNKPVKQLGYKEISVGLTETHRVDGSKVKKLTVQHTMDFYAASFPNLEILVYVDFPYCGLKKSGDGSRIGVSDNLGGGGPAKPADIILRKSSRTLDVTKFAFDYIMIPLNVKKIDSQVFEGISDVVIQTVYERKPDGWEDGWNGGCEVVWGAEL